MWVGSGSFAIVPNITLLSIQPAEGAAPFSGRGVSLSLFCTALTIVHLDLHLIDANSPDECLFISLISDVEIWELVLQTALMHSTAGAC